MINLKLKVWRQNGPKAVGAFEDHDVSVSADSSFLEMLDELNDSLERNGKDPVVFESDCREGICGTCGLVINGQPHGPIPKIATCQLHMRHFTEGQTIWIEPFRAKAFPVLKDLAVDRSAFDTIMHAGGYVSVNTGGVPDANAIAFDNILDNCVFKVCFPKTGPIAATSAPRAAESIPRMAKSGTPAKPSGLTRT